MIYLTLFLEFFKIGAFTFGGGYAMLPMIQEMIIKMGWLNEQQLIDFIAVSESTPGPFAVNISTYIGMHTGGFCGAVCATLGVVTPSFVIILLIAKCYKKFQENRIVKGCLTGLRPAVVAMIAISVLGVAGNVVRPVLTSPSDSIKTGIIFVIAAILSYRKAHPILIICVSGLLGIVAALI